MLHNGLGVISSLELRRKRVAMQVTSSPPRAEEAAAEEAEVLVSSVNIHHKTLLRQCEREGANHGYRSGEAGAV